MENNILPSNKIESVFAKIRQCEVCRTSTPPLPVTPNPIIRGNARSVIRIISQAPGTLAHNSSIPFKDPSGRRLRDWLGVDEDTFYNEDNFAITPMGFCFPGQDKNGGDLPPRKECAPLWQNKLDAVLPNVKLTLLVGSYAVKYVLGAEAKRNLTETVRAWESYGEHLMPLPHPSWRNNAWIKRHTWFASELEVLKARIARYLKTNS